MIPLICASPTNVLGLLTFIGWISGVPLLASVRAKYVPMAPSTAFCFSLIGVGLIAHLLRAALPWIPRLLRSNSRWKMLSARSSLRSNCTLPSLVTLAFQRRHFSTASSATSANFPNANHSTTMFVLWEWKCSTPVEFLAVAAVRAAERLNCCGRQRQLIELEQLHHKMFCLLPGKTIEMRS